MAFVQAEQTALLGISYPGEECDPFWDQFVAMMGQIDRLMFFHQVMNNLLLSGGGTRSWNGGTGIFTWTADFVVPVYFFGRKLNVKFGPDGLTRALVLQDGQAMALSIPSSMSDNTDVNFIVIDQILPANPEIWVAGFRNGSKLVLRGIGEIS